MIDRARDDPVTARQLPDMLTVGCRTVTGFYRRAITSLGAASRGRRLLITATSAGRTSGSERVLTVWAWNPGPALTWGPELLA